MERLKKPELEVAELGERLGQNSQNSSKPPSSECRLPMDAHRRQLCWAHLKREFLAIKGRGGISAEIGDGLEVKEIFEAWRALKDGSLSREELG